MKHLQVKNLPPELHEALRTRASQEGMTMSDYVIDLLRRDLALPSQREWFARLEQRDRVPTGEGIVAALEAVREEREEELVRARRRR